MIDKLDEVERRYDRLEADLANPETLGDSARLTKVMKERSSLERIVSVYREFKTVRADLAEAERMLASSDPDERALGKEEGQVGHQLAQKWMTATRPLKSDGTTTLLPCRSFRL